MVNETDKKNDFDENYKKFFLVQWHVVWKGRKAPKKIEKKQFWQKIFKNCWAQWHVAWGMRGSKDSSKTDKHDESAHRLWRKLQKNCWVQSWLSA